MRKEKKMHVCSIRLEERVVDEIEKLSPENNISLWIRMLVHAELERLGKLPE